MSDCVRLSEDELSGSYYPGDYTLQSSLTEKGLDVCRSECISADGDLCSLWRYTIQGTCHFAPLPSGVSKPVHDLDTKAAGYVRCDPQPSVFKMILMMLAVVAAAVLLYIYLLYCTRKGSGGIAY